MKSHLRRKIHNLVSDKKFSEILQGSVWALGAKVLATGVGLVTTIIIARAYGAEVLGTVAVLQAFLMLTTIFTVLGTQTSILRLIPEHLSKYSPTSAFRIYRKTQWMVAGVSVLTGTLLLFGSGFIAETIFSKPHLQVYFALASVFIIFKSLMLLNQQAVRGLRLIKVFALMQLLPHLSKLLILAPLTLFFFHQSNPVYAMFASFALSALVGAWIMDRAFKKRVTPKDTVQQVSVKHIWALSLPMFMTATMTFIIGQTGVIMLSIFRPEAEVGYYTIAVKLATLTAFIFSSINSMAGPKFSELYYSGKMDELFYIARKSAKLIFWTTTPILISFVFLGKPILYLVFGPEYTVAYSPLVLLVLGQFIHSICGATSLFMNMTGYQNMFRNIVVVAALCNILLNFLLIPRYGIHGAAIAGMLTFSGWNITALLYIKMKFGRSTGYFPMLDMKKKHTT